MLIHLFVTWEGQSIADVIGHKLTPNCGQRGQVWMGVIRGPEQLGRDCEGIRQWLAIDRHSPRSSNSILVLRFHNPEVRGPRDTPHRVLDVVAFAVGCAVLLWEAFGWGEGLHFLLELMRPKIATRFLCMICNMSKVCPQSDQICQNFTTLAKF